MLEYAYEGSHAAINELLPHIKFPFHTNGPYLLLCDAYQQSVSTEITHTYCFQTLEGIHYLEEVDC